MRGFGNGVLCACFGVLALGMQSDAAQSPAAELALAEKQVTETAAQSSADTHNVLLPGVQHAAAKISQESSDSESLTSDVLFPGVQRLQMFHDKRHARMRNALAKAAFGIAAVSVTALITVYYILKCYKYIKSRDSGIRRLAEGGGEHCSTGIAPDDPDLDEIAELVVHRLQRRAEASILNEQLMELILQEDESGDEDIAELRMRMAQIRLNETYVQESAVPAELQHMEQRLSELLQSRITHDSQDFDISEVARVIRIWRMANGEPPIASSQGCYMMHVLSDSSSEVQVLARAFWKASCQYTEFNNNFQKHLDGIRQQRQLKEGQLSASAEHQEPSLTRTAILVSLGIIVAGLIYWHKK